MKEYEGSPFQYGRCFRCSHRADIQVEMTIEKPPVTRVFHLCYDCFMALLTQKFPAIQIVRLDHRAKSDANA